MKKFILFIVLFLSGSLSYGQQYQSFIRSGAFWKGYHYQDPNQITLCQGQPDGLVRYFLKGDTIINSRSYYKLFRYVLPNNLIYCNYSEDVNYRGALREDTTTKRVYYLAPGNVQDTLLFYSNLSIGDTLISWSFGANGHSWIVDGIQDSVFYIDRHITIYRLVNSWSPCTMTDYLDNIGATSFFINDEPCTFQIIFCYGTKDLDSISPFFNDCLGLLVGIDTEQDNFVGVNVFPNPAKNYVTIKLRDSSFNFSSLELYDVFGNKLTYTIIALDNHNEITLNISKLASGCYIIVVRTKSGLQFNSKLVVY